MFSFLKKRASASDVALQVLMLVEGSRQSDAEWVKSLEELGVQLDRRRVLDELLLLRIFAGEYAICEALGQKPERHRVLQAYHAQFARETEWPEDIRAREAIKTRTVAYTKAALTPHHIGPAWTVGCLFAELCGKKEDLRFVVVGGMQLKLTVKFASEHVRSFRIV
jgi:hypothetical protein